MSSSEVYIPVQTARVSSERISEIEGESIGINSTPFRQDNNPFFSFQVLGEGVDSAAPNVDSKFHKISSYHGRSYELKDRVLWSDEFGNVYLSTSVKGNNHTNPHVMKSLTAPSGYIPMGVMEGDALLRIVRASQAMRKAGIGCEAIMQVFKPHALHFKGEQVTQEEYKKRLLVNAWQEVDAQGSQINRDDIPSVAQAFEGMEFYTVVRGLQVSERIEDLARVQTQEELEALLQRVFNSLNTIEHARKNETWEDLKVDNPSFLRYIKSILPRKIGQNYAMLHDEEMVHVFPHSGNITLAGEICDLDSVKGESIGCGDKRVGVRQIRQDVREMLRSSVDAVGRLQGRFVMMDSYRGNFMHELMISYLRNRKKGHFVQNLSLFHPNDVEELIALDSVRSFELFQMATDALQIDYSYEKGQQDIDEYTESHPEIIQALQKDDEIVVVDLGGLAEFTYQRIREDFTDKNGPLLDYLARRFGKAASSAITELFVVNWNEKVFQTLDPDAIDIGYIDISDKRIID